MKCSKCNHENPDSNKFCSECGTKLEVNTYNIECPYCHRQIPKDSKFCPDCGNKISYSDNHDELIFHVNGISFKMKYVDGQIDKDINELQISFYMGETVVTQELWHAVMGHHDFSFQGANLPAENVTWTDCQKFIRKISLLTKKDFRLPTVEEWVYAARGNTNFTYAGSNDINEVAWHKGNSDMKTHPVGKLKPNLFGIYDLSGNIAEWCQENEVELDRLIEESGGSVHKTKPADSELYATCGGNYWGEKEICKTSSIVFRNYNKKDSGVGLRLVLSLQKQS